jgi:putative ABC transport system permease protein
LAALEQVREAYPNLRVPVEVTMGEYSQMLTAAGVPMSAKGEGGFQSIKHGEFFPGEATACMLSLDMARQIVDEDPASLIGKSVTLSYATAQGNAGQSNPLAGYNVQRVDMDCPIVGIVERETGGFPGGAGSAAVSGVMIPLSTAKTIDATIVTNAQSLLRDRSEPRTYSSITVRVDQAQNTQDVQDRIKQMGYSVFSISDALSGAKNAFIVLDIVLGLIGSIALAVSSLGIVNTMVMSILERTREIGIMKAIGASDGDIRRIFLIEASAIGLLGGAMGIALGWIVGRAINFGANIYIQSQGGTPGSLFSLPLWLIGSALAFSVVVSLIAGSYPASRAARLNPVQALRHD